MIFSKSGRAGKKNIYTLNGRDLEITNSYCYLGINFSSNGQFKLAINSLTEKATRALFRLRLHNIRDEISVFFKLFNSLIAPIFKYGSEVWSPFEVKGLDSLNFMNLCDKSQIEKLNKTLCKYLLGIHIYSSNLAAKGELGSHSLLIQCYTIQLNFGLAFATKIWTRIPWFTRVIEKIIKTQLLIQNVTTGVLKLKTSLITWVCPVLGRNKVYQAHIQVSQTL
jgi:hypothetical protein